MHWYTINNKTCISTYKIIKLNSETCQCDKLKLSNIGGQFVNSVWLIHTTNYDGKPVYFFNDDGSIYYLYWVNSLSKWHVHTTIGSTSYYLMNEVTNYLLFCKIESLPIHM